MLRDDFFPALIEIAISAYGDLPKELADEFEVSQSTVRRWAHGVSRPHPYLKKAVVESILKKTKYAATRKSL